MLPGKLHHFRKKLPGGDGTGRIIRGTAYYVALLGQYYCATLADCYIPAVSADEFPSLGKMGEGCLTLAVSQSGETYDTLKALRHTKHRYGHTAGPVPDFP